MDYLVVFLIGAGVGIFANNKIVSIRKEKAKTYAVKKKASEVIMIQGKAYVPKKTKGKVRA